MNINQLHNLLIFILTVSCLWVCYFWLYKTHIVDLFRQKIFILRDQLFDEAADGFIDFNNEAYCILRRTMNGFLRFAHKISILEALIIFIMNKNDQYLTQQRYSYEAQLDNAIKDLGEDVKQKLKKYRMEMNRLLIIHLILRSPILVSAIFISLICLIVPLLIFVFLHTQITSLFNKILRIQLDNLKSAALAEGR